MGPRDGQPRTFIAPGAIEPAAIKQTDNADVYFYMDSNGDYSLNATDKSVVNNMIDSQYRPTDLAFHYDSTPTFNGSGETDHIWQKGLVDGSAEGRAWCVNPAWLGVGTWLIAPNYPLGLMRAQPSAGKASGHQPCRADVHRVITEDEATNRSDEHETVQESLPAN